jgi:hypothetical protein
MNWKKNLVPILFAFGGVVSLIPAVVGPVLRGEPLDVTFLVLATSFFFLATVFVAAGRKT